MKKLFPYAAALLLIPFQACDFLEAPPSTGLNEDGVFADRTLTERYITGIYAEGLPLGFSMGSSGIDRGLCATSTHAGACDEAESGTSWDKTNVNWNVNNHNNNDIDWEEDPRHDTRWSTIRKCNIVLERINEVPYDPGDPDFNTRSMGEGDTLLRYAFAFICFAMAAFSALRLAKFNIDESQHEEFCGLPTPANALFFVSLGMISARTGFDFGGQMLIWIVPAMAWLLISPVRMFSLKFRGFGWRGNAIRYLFLTLCVVMIAVLRLYSIPAIVILYILISAIRWGLRRNSND